MTNPAEHRLLAVFAHPDDETIGAGGYLALAAAAGVDVSVVTCTRGERGEVIPPELAELAGDERALAYYREGELSAALAELGANRHLFLDQVPGLKQSRPSRFRDSGMVWLRPGIAGPVPDAGPYAFTAVDIDLAARLLAVVIRHVRPTAVLTEEPGGGYGHPDHVHTHRVTMRAVELAAAAEPAPSPEEPDPLAGLPTWQVPTVLWVAQDEADARAGFHELAEHVARHGAPRGADGAELTVPDLDGELPGLIVPSEQVVAALDARPVADRMLAALRAHRSQIQAVQELPGATHLLGQLGLSNGALMPVLSKLHLRPAPGYDVGDLPAVLTLGDRGATTTEPGPAAGTTPDATPVGGQRAAEGPSTATGTAHGGAVGPPIIGAPGVSSGWTEADIPAAPVRSEARAGRGEPVEAGPGGPGAPGERGVQPGSRRELVAEPGEGEEPTPERGQWVPNAVAGLVGVVMALLGTTVHRFSADGWPVGVVVALVGVLAAAVAARALARGTGVFLVALGVFLTTQAMTFLRPGGDVLVTDELISYVWLFGAIAMCFASLALPRRWFADHSRTGQGR